MHLPLTSTILLLLPLTSAARSHVHGHNHAHAHPNNNNPRGVTDKVKGLFGDPVAMINDLPPCMRLCASIGTFSAACLVDTDDPIEQQNSDYLACLCANGGAKWENGTRECFEPSVDDDDGSGKNKTTNIQLPSSGKECKLNKDYDEGKVTEVCKAVAEKPDKTNETATAILDMVDKDMWGEVEIKMKKLKEEKAGNATSSGAAAAAGGAGGARMVGGLVLVAAVGCAVALL
ncbi:hypothetical protein NEMBOFW57_004189 [Staphylotrichum longicolle]|uniref:Extracellular membrane protein CFEM domain-containing protein n=1 Tax=Staphylotrichum longicolle TaxID=669026 RepID=A0AAD4F7L9_9PEZI|nr:hypothetical protein NEMBOFW57_004189 [Staphylotrichum longicolle]